MKTNFIDTHSIPEVFLPYLINGDPSGLSDEDINAIDAYTTGLIQAFNAPLYFNPYDESGNYEPYFSWRNNVTGFIGSTVIDVQVFIIK